MKELTWETSYGCPDFSCIVSLKILVTKFPLTPNRFLEIGMEQEHTPTTGQLNFLVTILVKQQFHVLSGQYVVPLVISPLTQK